NSCYFGAFRNDAVTRYFGEWADYAVGADAGVTADEAERVNHRIRPDGDAGFDVDVVAAGDAHAAGAQLALDAVLHDGIHLRLLVAGIDGQHVLGRHRLDRQYLAPGPAKDAEYVGQVVFAFLIFVLEPAQGKRQLVG